MMSAVNQTHQTMRTYQYIPLSLRDNTLQKNNINTTRIIYT